MEGGDVLSSFYSNICDYFSGKCATGKCSLVKKHREHLRTDGDFSIVYNVKAQQKHAQVNVIHDTLCVSRISELCPSPESDVDRTESERISKSLLKLSGNWALKLAHCSVHNDRLYLHLNKLHTFETMLYCILSQESLYGKLPNNHKKVLLTSEPVKHEFTMNLTEYRRNLVKQVLKNLLTERGHTVILDSKAETSFGSDLHYHLSTKSLVPGHAKAVIHCGMVSVTQKCNEKDLLVTDYLRQRYKKLKEMSRQKHGPQVDDSKWDNFFSKIGEASLRIDLLSVRPSRNFNVNLTDDSQETSRNAHFILYNCARLSALQERYDKKCSENIYPSLVPLEKIDFSLLTKEEEWELLSNYLLVYPQVLQSTIEFIDKGKPLPNLLCQFLFSLCGCYSGYYRRVRILTESRDHLLPVMFARLYLLKAVECVLHSGLRLLGIEPVRYM